MQDFYSFLEDEVKKRPDEKGVDFYSVLEEEVEKSPAGATRSWDGYSKKAVLSDLAKDTKGVIAKSVGKAMSLQQAAQSPAWWGELVKNVPRLAKEYTVDAAKQVFEMTQDDWPERRQAAVSRFPFLRSVPGMEEPRAGKKSEPRGLKDLGAMAKGLAMFPIDAMKLLYEDPEKALRERSLDYALLFAPKVGGKATGIIKDLRKPILTAKDMADSFKAAGTVFEKMSKSMTVPENIRSAMAGKAAEMKSKVAESTGYKGVPDVMGGPVPPKSPMESVTQRIKDAGAAEAAIPGPAGAVRIPGETLPKPPKSDYPMGLSIAWLDRDGKPLPPKESAAKFMGAAPQFVEKGQKAIDPARPLAAKPKRELSQYGDKANPHYLQEKEGPLVPVKLKSNVKAPVYDYEIAPFANGELPDLQMGKLRKAFENPYRWMEDYPELHGPLMNGYNAGVRQGGVANKALMADIKKWEKALTPEQRSAVWRQAVARQKGGMEHLAAMGEDIKLRDLTPVEGQFLAHLDKSFEQWYGAVNRALELNGQPLMEKVPNYFTFLTDLDGLDKMGISLIADSPTVIGNALGLIRQHGKGKDVPFKFAKERKPGARVPLVSDPLKVWETYGKRANELIALTPVIAKVNAFLSPMEVVSKAARRAMREELKAKGITGPEIGAAMKRAARPYKLADTHPEIAKMLRVWADTVAGKKDFSTIDLMRAFERGVGKFGRNIATSVMGFNPRTTAIQISSLANTWDQIGLLPTVKGLIESVVSPSKREFAKKNSDVLAIRSIDVEVYNAIGSKPLKTMGHAWKKLVDSAFAPIKLLDQAAATATWTGGYNFARRVLSHEESVKWANQLVLKTQASGLPGHAAPIQNVWYGRALTLMQTFGINDFNHFLKDVMGVGDAAYKGTRSLPTFVRATNYLIGRTLFNIVFEDVLGIRSPFPTPIREAMSEYERSGSIPKSAKEFATELASVIPVIGGVLRYSYPGRTSTPAVIQTATDLAGALIKTGDWVVSIGEPGGRKLSRVDFEALTKTLGLPGATALLKYLGRRKSGYSVIESLLGARTDVKKEGAKKKGAIAPWVE